MSALPKTEQEISAWTMLRRCARQKLSDELMFGVMKRAGWAVVKPLIINAYHIVKRDAVRVVEHQAAGEIVLAESVGDRTEALRRLAHETFVLPDGARVKFNEATAEQHEIRARWLRKIADGNIATAKLHERTAKDIRAAGVSCFGELLDKNYRECNKKRGVR